LDAALEGPVDVAEMADEFLLERPDVGDNPVKADVMALALGSDENGRSSAPIRRRSWVIR
jgi:hypothetical protein